MSDSTETSDDLLAEAAEDAVATEPGDSADPRSLVEGKIPEDILEKYEVVSYRNAAVILSDSRKREFDDLLVALREFRITKRMIRMAGGNESDIPKLFSEILRPRGWNETIIQGDLHLRLLWKEQLPGLRRGKAAFEKKEKRIVRSRYLDGHKIDYVKGKTAFDLEWNSKDQTFDRDLYAFRSFAETGVIDVAVLVTRGTSLTQVFRELGPALRKDGQPELKKTGEFRMTYEKYGASTTWMGKLLYRLNAGRNGACPVLAIGITPECIDWSETDEA